MLSTPRGPKIVSSNGRIGHVGPQRRYSQVPLWIFICMAGISAHWIPAKVGVRTAPSSKQSVGRGGTVQPSGDISVFPAVRDRPRAYPAGYPWAPRRTPPWAYIIHFPGIPRYPAGNSRCPGEINAPEVVGQ